jgi:tetratricopeptide (TPR) repeat protein
MIGTERPDEGLALVEEATRLVPEWGLTHYWLAVALERVERLDDAAEAASRAHELDARNETYAREAARLLFSAGFRAQEAGELARAIEWYRRHLRLAPEASQTHFNLAHALMESGSHALAVEHFERTLVLRPDYREVHRHLATCFAALGDEPARARQEALYRAGG